MKKLSKRFLTLAIACVMAMAMAVPAFAADTVGAVEDCFFRCYNGQGEYLNTWGNTVSQGSSIRMYTYTGDKSQKWRIYRNPGGSYSLRCLANPALAINRADGTKYAILWTWSEGRTDSDMRMYIYDNNTRYHFMLIDGNEYLTALGTSTGSYVNFQTYKYGSTALQWKKM